MLRLACCEPLTTEIFTSKYKNGLSYERSRGYGTRYGNSIDTVDDTICLLFTLFTFLKSFTRHGYAVCAARLPSPVTHGRSGAPPALRAPREHPIAMRHRVRKKKCTRLETARGPARLVSRARERTESQRRSALQRWLRAATRLLLRTCTLQRLLHPHYSGRVFRSRAHTKDDSVRHSFPLVYCETRELRGRRREEERTTRASEASRVTCCATSCRHAGATWVRAPAV
jgi:hypothetical protein